MFKLTILYTFFFVIISVPVIIGCNNGKGKQTAINKLDSAKTEKVLAVYKSATTGHVEANTIKRIHVVDTFSWKEASPGHLELKGGPDYYYLITYTLAALDSTGKEIRDSAGKIMFKTVELPTDKKWVRSGFENLDSAIKELNELK